MIACGTSRLRRPRHDVHLHRYHDEEHDNLLNAMWLIAVTVLCVGYGDIVPNTYCGRSLAVVCGIMVSAPQNLTQTYSLLNWLLS